MGSCSPLGKSGQDHARPVTPPATGRLAPAQAPFLSPAVVHLCHNIAAAVSSTMTAMQTEWVATIGARTEYVVSSGAGF
jgi:hypothetical protein